MNGGISQEIRWRDDSMMMKDIAVASRTNVANIPTSNVISYWLEVLKQKWVDIILNRVNWYIYFQNNTIFSMIAHSKISSQV